MAWIEVHQSLWDHRKTMEVADALELPELYAASHLIALWTWALDNAPDGSLPASNRIVAKGAKWPGDPDTFCHALRNAGFLDTGAGGLVIHDWDDYGGKLTAQRKANAERQKRHRNRAKQQSDADPQGTRGVTSPQPDEDVTVTSPLRNAPENSREEKSREQDHRGERARDRDDAADAAPPPKEKTSRHSAQKPVPLPDDFAVSVHMRGWALQHTALSERELDTETEKFRQHYLANGQKQADWVAKWRQWMLRETEFRERRASEPPRSRGRPASEAPRPPDDMTDEEAEKFYLREIHERQGARP